jgi:hypothetical protein
VQLERCLRHIFAKYCTPCPARPPKQDSTILLTPPDDAILDAAGLDAWAQDTNGAPFSEETKEELREFLDVTEEGELTCVIFHSSSLLLSSIPMCSCSNLLNADSCIFL